MPDAGQTVPDSQQSEHLAVEAKPPTYTFNMRTILFHVTSWQYFSRNTKIGLFDLLMNLYFLSLKSQICTAEVCVSPSGPMSVRIEHVIILYCKQ